MLKAKLLEKGIQYPRKHDLVCLLELFDNKEILDKHIENAANLSDYLELSSLTCARMDGVQNPQS